MNFKSDYRRHRPFSPKIPGKIAQPITSPQFGIRAESHGMDEF